MDETPPEPSSSPAVSPLPPILTEEPIKKLRNFYVYSGDVDLAAGGFGFTPGCDGCKAIVNGKRSLAHSETCKLKVMQQASSNPKIAARVKRSVEKDHEAHTKILEEGEERKKQKEASTIPTAESATPPAEGSAGAPRSQVGGSASSGSSDPSSGSAPRKRGADVQLNQKQLRRSLQRVRVWSKMLRWIFGTAGRRTKVGRRLFGRWISDGAGSQATED